MNVYISGKDCVPNDKDQTNDRSQEGKNKRIHRCIWSDQSKYVKKNLTMFQCYSALRWWLWCICFFQEKAKQEIADSEILFNTLIERVQEAKTNLTTNILEKLRKSREKDDAMIEKIQEEIAKLQRRHSELEELSQSKDPFQLLQVRKHLNLK